MSHQRTSCLRTSACKLVFLLFSLSAVFSGCGHNQVVRQLQSENDRLLAEFRAEREQKLQLSEKLAATQARLAESEKLVARQNPLPASRISRIEPTGPTFNSQSLNSGQSLNSTPTNLNRIAPTGAPQSDLQWRPLNKTPR